MLCAHRLHCRQVGAIRRGKFSLAFVGTEVTLLHGPSWLLHARMAPLFLQYLLFLWGFLVACGDVHYGSCAFRSHRIQNEFHSFVTLISENMWNMVHVVSTSPYISWFVSRFFCRLWGLLLLVTKVPWVACIEQANGRSASLLGTALALAEPCVAGNISMFGGCSRYIYI